ncbi:GGDEF domain-containing protein [Marinomonas sp. THO17]|uniref:GGDEF domain-containing protein n=1 Tax=Marinomonas sp. THO17 TaxID=3149048 RepID=UPI00336BDA8F
MFQHSTKEANQLMRSAIPLMVKLDIPPTPYNYGIWYQYASNSNPKLNQVVDRAIRRFGSLPAFVSKELFNEFIMSEDIKQSDEQHASLNHLTETLSEESVSITKELSIFNQSLKDARNALNNSPDQKRLEQIATLLDRRAFKANQIVEQFGETLIHAQDELVRLRQELADVKKNTELDPMTLLSNEKGFERTLFSLAPFAEDDLTLLLIEIDDLANFQQEYGKKVTASLILYIAKALTQFLPELAFISRLKNGKFAVILKEMELGEASDLADATRLHIAQQKIRNKNDNSLLRKVTASIGVATLLGDESPIDLVQRTQHYLTYAQRSGKNRVAHHV